ncbi:sugar ABC transporter permease [Cellulomonas aerilata]|uniref:Sugar ABC transporter permease n=1 Tax=Cellulomonas aerilata TaxID=515326 RepID=A0A512DBQ3_9CELL|nr:sugar ABC transporter permease [Cellulomonas aerilata]
MRGDAARRPARSWRRRLAPYGFLLPAFVLYGMFLLVPILRAAQLSLFEWDGLTLGTFVGLDNYAAVVTDPRLREAFGHALVLVVFFSLLPVAIGLLLAAVLNRGRVRGLPFFRTVIFLPQVVAMVVVAVAWRQIYAPDGWLNDALRGVGLGSLTRPWLGDFTYSLPAVGTIGTWVSMGLVTVLLLAGMSRVPTELYEAARLDGAGAVRELVAITLPAVRAEITVALTLTIIAALKTFDLVYVTTGGGPGTSTTVPSYEVYRRAFQLGEVGMAAAVGITLMVLIFAINLVVNRVGDRSTT